MTVLGRRSPIGFLRNVYGASLNFLRNYVLQLLLHIINISISQLPKCNSIWCIRETLRKSYRSTLFPNICIPEFWRVSFFLFPDDCFLLGSIGVNIGLLLILTSPTTLPASLCTGSSIRVWFWVPSPVARRFVNTPYSLYWSFDSQTYIIGLFSSFATGSTSFSNVGFGKLSSVLSLSALDLSSSACFLYHAASVSPYYPQCTHPCVVLPVNWH